MPVVSIRFFLILLSSTLGVETTATIGSQVHLLHHPLDRKHIGPSNGVHLHPRSPPSESDELISLKSDDVEGKHIKELLRPGVGWKKSIREGTAEEERRATASFLKPQAQPSDSHDQNGETFQGGSTSSKTAKKRSLGKTDAHRLEEPTQINMNTPTHSVISDIRSTGLISTYSNNSEPPSRIKQREPKIQPVHETQKTDGKEHDTIDRHLIHHVHEEDTAPRVEEGKVLEAPEKEGTKTYLPSMSVALSQTQITIGIIFGVFVIVCLIGFACISRSKPPDIMDPRFSSGSSCKTASIDSNDFQPYDVKDLSQKQL